jgi:hypothetical protein
VAKLQKRKGTDPKDWRIKSMKVKRQFLTFGLEWSYYAPVPKTLILSTNTLAFKTSLGNSEL